MTSCADATTVVCETDAAVWMAPTGRLDEDSSRPDRTAHALVRSLLSGLGIEGSLDTASIDASLAEISRFGDPHTRLKAAIDSTLGHWLGLQGLDLGAVLPLLVAAVPSRA